MLADALRRASLRRRYDGTEDGEVVAGAAGQDEEVPHGVIVGQTLPGVEDDACGIKEASG
jgi:hypothetical protein